MLVRHQTYHFWYLCLSPLFIILLGFLTATYFNKLIGGWAWIPLAIVYWSTLSFLIGTFKKEKKLKDWLQKSQRSPVWTTLSLIIGIIPLTILLQNYSLFQSIWIIFSWLLFALINPWLEEYYWRGILLEGLMTKVPQWVAIVYTTIFFVLSHPLMWGVFSYANRSVHLYIYLFIAGIIWSMTTIKTKSLRVAILSHLIVDIGNLTVLTFLNIYIPPV